MENYNHRLSPCLAFSKNMVLARGTNWRRISVDEERERQDEEIINAVCAIMELKSLVNKIKSEK